MRPLAILLAVYEPNISWLESLLDSLNAQTYPSIRLYVRDDASPTFRMDKLEQLLREHITRFPYETARNEQNRGSNQTFAALLASCKEDYVAFCDQDDIWLPDKLTKTVALLETDPLRPTLVCTDVEVMDENERTIAHRMQEHRRRHVFLRGEHLAPVFLYRNFALGCTTVMERERAQNYLPFPDCMVHDQYLAFRASLDGAIDYLEEPQLRYRVWGKNQTAVMTGIDTKADYYRKRVFGFDARIREMARYATLPEIDRAIQWSDARVALANRKKGAWRALFRLRSCDSNTSLMELTILLLPAPLFRFVMRLLQKGVL